jgi:hypothetical protein
MAWGGAANAPAQDMKMLVAEMIIASALTPMETTGN